MQSGGKVRWRKDKVGICIFDSANISSIVEIPDLIEGEIVVKVGKRAFAECRGLEEIRLGRFLEEIDNNAFYNCRNLRTVELWDRLRSVGDGAFKNCEKFDRIRLHVTENRTSCVRDILGECQREVMLELWYEDGPVKIWFPDYEIEYHAEGFTLSVHFTAIEHGSGYAYRQCMQGRNLDYRAYDSLFERAAREDRKQAVAAIALLRLRYPRELSSAYRDAYREWLLLHASDAIAWILESGEEDLLDYMREEGLFTADNLSDCLRVAEDAGDPAAAAMLLRATLELEQRRTAGSLRKRYEL